MPTPFQLLHGVDAPPAAGIVLRAGPISALFEPEIGFLRYVRCGGREVVRGIYGAVRDAAWGTVAPEVSDLEVVQSDDSFHVRFTMKCRAGEIDFRWTGEISGDASSVRYTLNGIAEQAFDTNRTGLCVLHPLPEGAAAECVIERIDGEELSGRFPALVEPHQPFQGLRSITQEIAPGLTARIAVEGDTFEMEDQRNWTDASFKTYSRPLALPKPYQLQAGDLVQQSITVTFDGEVPSAVSEETAVSIQIEPQSVGRLPQVGLGMASHGSALSPREVELLRVLRPLHLRVDLYLARPGYREELERAASEASALRARLEVALFVTRDAAAELADFTQALHTLRVPVARWLLFQEGERATPEHLVSIARRLLRESLVFAPLGAGTNNSFADLNRNRTAAAQADFVTFAINPQVHAFDDRTLIENLEGQAHAAHSARWLAHGKPVVISPVTLRPRFNAEAVGAEEPPAPGELPFGVDHRQMSLFGAGWTVGSLHALARAGVSAATFFETTGWRGVLETAAGSPLAAQFASFPRSVFPLYHVLADVAGTRAEVLTSHSSHPLDAEALALRLGDGKMRLLVANHTANAQTIRISGLSDGSARARVLDLESVEVAMRSPDDYRSTPCAPVRVVGGALTLELGPFAVATLDLERGDE